MGKQGPCYHCGVTSEFLFLQIFFKNFLICVFPLTDGLYYSFFKFCVCEFSCGFFIFYFLFCNQWISICVCLLVKWICDANRCASLFCFCDRTCYCLCICCVCNSINFFFYYLFCQTLLFWVVFLSFLNCFSKFEHKLL